MRIFVCNQTCQSRKCSWSTKCHLILVYRHSDISCNCWHIVSTLWVSYKDDKLFHVDNITWHSSYGVWLCSLLYWFTIKLVQKSMTVLIIHVNTLNKCGDTENICWVSKISIQKWMSIIWLLRHLKLNLPFISCKWILVQNCYLILALIRLSMPDGPLSLESLDNWYDIAELNRTSLLCS